MSYLCKFQASWAGCCILRDVKTRLGSLVLPGTQRLKSGCLCSLTLRSGLPDTQ